MQRAEIKDSMHGIQAQSVEVILLKPVERVVDEETADLIAGRAVKVDCLSPGTLIATGEVRTIFAEIVPFRSQMVVNNVEGYGESVLVSGIDQPLQALRVAVCILG